MSVYSDETGSYHTHSDSERSLTSLSDIVTSDYDTGPIRANETIEYVDADDFEYAELRGTVRDYRDLEDVQQLYVQD